jgi:tellurite resistance protein
MPLEDIENIISQCIRVFVKEHNDAKTAEKFISKLTTLDAIVAANILIGKLRGAYLLSVQARRTDLIKQILQVAISTNQSSVQKLCEKYLSQFPS